MATHSSVLAWRIPGMGEPGGLPSMGSHRVGHNWSDLAAVAATLGKAGRWVYRNSVYYLCKFSVKSKLFLNEKLKEIMQFKQTRSLGCFSFPVYPRQEEKGMTEDKMVGWHHWLDGHEFGQALGVGDRQGSLACCSPWGRKESDRTEQLNNSNYNLHDFMDEIIPHW